MRERVKLPAFSTAEELTEDDRARMLNTLAADVYVYNVAKQIAANQARCLESVQSTGKPGRGA
jgi:hypothetical protein